MHLIGTTRTRLIRVAVADEWRCDVGRCGGHIYISEFSSKGSGPGGVRAGGMGAEQMQGVHTLVRCGHCNPVGGSFYSPNTELPGIYFRSGSKTYDVKRRGE